ncbi:TATA box-binding protein-like 1 isoform X1 [Lytechinus variegatus]|uniref:TATA box-binding protein-like 1 isoform X1 n=2 Tax=Lytechinus variegatus TaxID=7654 RepID=UPI001BB27CEE|nr:TATA box-binding protein-like 1 isoform X1 [Lytechinus variegatus]XP_041484202.1 TATA box-binding protein-like 1 isoform X1 [Lytechinus variegatus]
MMNSSSLATQPQHLNSSVMNASVKQENTAGDAESMFYRDASIRRVDADTEGVKVEERLEIDVDDKGTVHIKKEQEVEKKGGGEDGIGNEPSVDIYINNVVCAFSVRCHLNLRRIGQSGANVEYRREYGKVNMRFRNPPATATIWSSGKITITGNDSEEHAKKTARKCARALQKMGFNVRFSRYKVVNVLGTCSLPFAIRIRDFSQRHPSSASYEPELHPAVTYKMYNPRATLKIFSTGSITVTAPAVDNISKAIEHIYPLVEVHKTPLSEATIQKRLARKRKREGYVEDDEENTDDEYADEDALDDEEDSDEYSSDDSS